MSQPTLTDATFDARWAAWQERGRAHDRRVNARLRVALPTIAFVAAVGYLLLLR